MKVFADEKPHRSFQYVIDHNNKPRWRDLRANPYYNEDNNLLGSIEVITDHTKIKKIEEALQKAHDELNLRAEGLIAELAKTNEQLKLERNDRKRTEEMLRLFSHSVDSSIDGIAMGNFENRLIYVNETFAKMFGYSREGLTGKEITSIYPEDQIPKFEEALKKTMEGSWKGELIGKKKDGELFPVSVSSSRIVDDEGNVIGHMASHRDISERKQAEHDLRESEKKYRTILESIEDGYFEVDISGNFTFFNDSMCKIFGYSKDELMGMNNRQYTDQENAKKVYQTFNRVYNTGKPAKGFDYEFIRKDGTKRHIETSVSLIKDAEGQRIGFRGIFRDVTERKRAEEALRESEERFRILVEKSPLGISLIGKDGRYKYINPRFVETFGYTLKDIPTGRAWFRKAFPDEKYRHQVISKWITALEKLKQGKSRPQAFNITCKDGSEKIINFRPVMMETGDQFIIHEDITDRKQAEEALREREEELEIKTNSLQEVNVALRVLLKRRDQDKIELEEKVLSNVKDLVVPCVEKMKNSRLDPKQLAYINIIESTLNDIISPFSRTLTSKYLNLTPTEIHVSNLIKEGKSNKEMAGLMNLSIRTIEFHRDNIRKKLGLKNQKANLRTHLLSLT